MLAFLTQTLKFKFQTQVTFSQVFSDFGVDGWWPPGTIEGNPHESHDLLVRFALFNNHHFFLFWFIRENPIWAVLSDEQMSKG